MLIYFYKCSCGETFQTENKHPECVSCGKDADWYKVVMRGAPPIRRIGGEHITYSRSLAIDPSQVEEAVRLHPDEHYVMNAREGIAMLEIRSAKHQEKMAERHGMVCHAKCNR